MRPNILPEPTSYKFSHKCGLFYKSWETRLPCFLSSALPTETSGKQQLVLGGRPHSSEWPHTQKYKLDSKKLSQWLLNLKE